MPFFYGDRIREALSRACGDLPAAPVDPKRFRMPAGDACAFLWLPQAAERVSMRPCSLYGAPLVESAVPCEAGLRFTFTFAFFDALLERVLSDLPHPGGDLSDPALGKYLRLAGGGEAALPDAPGAGVCLLSFCCLDETGLPGASGAEQALTRGMTPEEKRRFYAGARPFYEGLARLAFQYLTERNETK